MALPALGPKATLRPLLLLETYEKCADSTRQHFLVRVGCVPPGIVNLYQPLTLSAHERKFIQARVRRWSYLSNLRPNRDIAPDWYEFGRTSERNKKQAKVTCAVSGRHAKHSRVGMWRWR